MACCLLLMAGGDADARDFVRGPLVVNLSDRWTVVEEPGPELIKANLAQDRTATLSMWRYKPGAMSADQFLSGLRADLGWMPITADTRYDPRFGPTSGGLYTKLGAYGELPFKIRSYDFVLDGDIYVLVMSSPESRFEVVDSEFQAVFSALSNMSGVTAREATGPRPEAAPQRIEPPVSSIPQPAPRIEPPSTNVPNVPPSYTFYYELPGGLRMGYDALRREAAVIDPAGKVKTTFPIAGTPYLSPNGFHVLSDEYAYQIDPSNGNVIGRRSVQDFLSAQSSGHVSSEVHSKVQPEIQNPKSKIQNLQSENDAVKSALGRAADMRRMKGVKAAMDYLTGLKAAIEKSGSPHLYEFYFRLGEYWEESGDLETALAYYRLATKAID
ncbi:MAG: hypothetical protein A3G34_00230 [Candidatus Lindowbacteria bacterium RIFCSPLOWO2_12_FULL_62_27]|nr:MAG: hypothetical protein A3G34_00230 [Candidatus Lindowbacteria bacterium RIFCSPLOWO2_12_FULL_62_27]OGH57925.1 MAG: hypothetical protein A3I06_10650 [Candidatus Lindowbacteria bacterium RIFCSPLOWO2_02_FULL_62_12]